MLKISHIASNWCWNLLPGLKRVPLSIILNEISTWGQLSKEHSLAYLGEVGESTGKKKFSSSYPIKNNWRLVSRLGAFTWDAFICVKLED